MSTEKTVVTESAPMEITGYTRLGEREDVARSITIKFANAFIIPAKTG